MSITHYKLRIDSHDCVESITQGINVYSYVFEGLSSFENPEESNPHTHFYLATRLKSDSIRKRIKKLPNYKPGNGFYSLSKLDPGDDPDFPYLKYHAYMAKEGLPVYSGFLRERLNKLKHAIVEHNAKVKLEIKSKRKSRRTILQQMEDDFKYSERTDLDRNTVVRDVVEWYKINDKLPREFLMVSQVQYLLLKYDPDYQITLETNILRSIDKSH